MKHSDLKVGMKVKLTSNFSNNCYVSSKGNISTVKEILDYTFTVEEDDGTNYYYWFAEYFEPVEEAKEKEIMNTEHKLITMQCADKTISLDKKYKTRCGYPVRVLCTDFKKNNTPVLSAVEFKDGTEYVIAHTQEGIYQQLSDFDLIEVSPYEDFKKDDKVMVSCDGKEWYKRHFAYEKDGVAYCFRDGATHWSSPGAAPWIYFRKPTQEEMGE